MSPEQTLGDPQLPYEIKRRALPEVVRVIREHDPEALSMMQRTARPCPGHGKRFRSPTSFSPGTTR